VNDTSRISGGLFDSALKAPFVDRRRGPGWVRVVFRSLARKKPREAPSYGIPGIHGDARTELERSSEPAPQTAVLHVSEKGTPTARVKIALGRGGDSQISVEASWLKRLEGDARLCGNVPRLLGEGVALNGRRYLMTSPLSGRAGGDSLSPAHLGFLKALGAAGARPAGFRDSACFHSLESSLAQLDLGYEALDALQSASRDCWLALAAWSGPFVISNGNFLPRTVLMAEQGVLVPDWERARIGANPLADVLHFLLAPRALSGKRLSRWFMRRVLRQAQAAARLIHPAGDWGDRAVSALALAYVLETLVWQARARRGAALPAAGYWRLVERRAQWMAP
jgi:hypothetical protein